MKLLPCVLFEKYNYILALEMASPVNQHCANCIGTLSFPVGLHLELRQNGGTDQHAVWGVDSRGPRKEPIIKGARILHHGRGIMLGHARLRLIFARWQKLPVSLLLVDTIDIEYVNI